MSQPLFHLAFPVQDLDATRDFYTQVLHCAVGREAERWIDFNFFGHQISAHLVDTPESTPATNPVDGKTIPVRHFGVILDWDEWHTLAFRLQSARIPFIVEPYIRFAGEAGEQATMFFSDPSGNMLEFKSFREPGQVFATKPNRDDT